MSPELPRNIKLGQIRRTLDLVLPAKWRGIKEDERAAVDALSLHIGGGHARKSTKPSRARRMTASS